MDEDLDKQNKKLQEDPDDFDVKNHIFTQESMVSIYLYRKVCDYTEATDIHFFSP